MNYTVTSASHPICKTKSCFVKQVTDFGGLFFVVYFLLMVSMVVGSSALVWLRPPIYLRRREQINYFFARNSLQNFWPFWKKSLKERWGSVDGLRGWSDFFIMWSNSYRWNETCEGCRNPEGLHVGGTVRLPLCRSHRTYLRVVCSVASDSFARCGLGPQSSAFLPPNIFPIAVSTRFSSSLERSSHTGTRADCRQPVSQTRLSKMLACRARELAAAGISYQKSGAVGVPVGSKQLVARVVCKGHLAC